MASHRQYPTRKSSYRQSKHTKDYNPPTQKKKQGKKKRAIMGSRRRNMRMKKISPSDVDRISDLPEKIIHLILGSLPSHEEAARSSILSRRWLGLWSTYPVVEFRRRNDIKFQSFAAATSKRVKLAVPPLLLDTFSISLGSPRSCSSDDDPDTQNWLRYGELLLSSLGSTRSPLKVVFKNHLHTEHSASLDARLLTFFNRGRTKFLELEGFDLSGLHDFKMENLQKLSLKRGVVSQQSFPSCLANAPRLEKLSLERIEGIDSLDISASNFPSLKSLNFDAYAQIFYLNLSSAPLLETLSFLGDCKLLNVVSAPCVKSVHLSPKGELSRIMLEELISKFPSLESLCFNASHISSDNDKLRISSGTLRELTFIQSMSKMEFEIDAPNLETLTIHTSGLKINSTVVKVPPTCRCVLDYALFGDTITTSWFIKLSKCLAALAPHFRRLDFKLDISLSTKVSKLDTSLIRCQSTPLMAISVLQSRSDQSLFSYINKQIKMENLEKCCSNGNCWRHQFKDVKIASVTVDDVSTTINEPTISQPSIDMMLYLSRGKIQYYI
ncbi:Putative F-box/LRR-repeat protein At3g28410 [Linum grandiflorum]